VTEFFLAFFDLILNPWSWFHLVLLIIFLILFFKTSRILTQQGRRLWLLIGLFYFVFQLVNLSIAHPVVDPIGLMVILALVLRFIGQYTNTNHPGFVYLFVNLIFLSVFIVATFFPTLIPYITEYSSFLPLFLATWPILNIFGAFFVAARLKGIRVNHGKMAGAFAVLPWLVPTIYNIFIEVNRLFNLVRLPLILSQGEIVQHVLNLIPFTMVIYLWSYFLADHQKQAQTTIQDQLWTKKTLSYLIDSLSYQMQPGLSHRQAFLSHTAEKIGEMLGAAGIGVFLVDEYKDVLKVEVIKGTFPPLIYLGISAEDLSFDERVARFLNTEIPLDHRLIRRCIKELKVQYYETVALTDEFYQTGQAIDWEELSLMLAPLHFVGKLIGIMGVSFLRAENKVQPRTMRRFKDISSWLSQILYSFLRFEYEKDKHRIDIESAQIKEIQALLLPKRIPRLLSVEIAAFSRPARGVSGDYYDVIPLRKGEFLLVIGDVAGKGLPASITMVMIKTILYLLAFQPKMSPARLLNLINWGVAGKIGVDRYATMSIAHYDMSTRKLTYANAAHHPILIYHSAKKSFAKMDTEGIPIGLEKSTKYRETFTTLEKNDIIMLYTDGIIEAVGGDKGDFFGLERLKKFILSNCQLKADKLKRALENELDSFCGNSIRQDDQTILMMRVER